MSAELSRSRSCGVAGTHRPTVPAAREKAGVFGRNEDPSTSTGYVGVSWLALLALLLAIGGRPDDSVRIGQDLPSADVEVSLCSLLEKRADPLLCQRMCRTSALDYESWLESEGRTCGDERSWLGLLDRTGHDATGVLLERLAALAASLLASADGGTISGSGAFLRTSGAAGLRALESTIASPRPRSERTEAIRLAPEMEDPASLLGSILSVLDNASAASGERIEACFAATRIVRSSPRASVRALSGVLPALGIRALRFGMHLLGDAHEREPTLVETTVRDALTLGSQADRLKVLDALDSPRFWGSELMELVRERSHLDLDPLVRDRSREIAGRDE